MVMANHEVTGVLITTSDTRLPQGVLLANEPREIRWFYEGRAALRSEVQQAIKIAHERDKLKHHPNRTGDRSQTKYAAVARRLTPP
jgi:hypothetical protein